MSWALFWAYCFCTVANVTFPLKQGIHSMQHAHIWQVYVLHGFDDGF